MERTWQFDYFKPVWPETGNRFPIEQYPYRLSLRRKNRSGAGPYWDPVWRECGLAAVSELCESMVLFDAQLRFARREEYEAVRARAEEIFARRIGKPGVHHQ
ncbi:hypothetical protein QYR00_25015 (plasmid) [Agrobacterium tumefaciens]|nr:hypothetical protein QYR00_25015 [Agrobacterium tumefaciens]